MCPENVHFTRAENTNWLSLFRDPDSDLRPADVSTDSTACQTFSAQVRFENLRFLLRIESGAVQVEWHAATYEPDLAVHYSDHKNNVFAVRIFRALLPQAQDDFSKLKLVATALDSLHRRLDPSYPHWEDLYVWLASPDSSYLPQG